MTVIAAVADGNDVWMAADTGEPVNGTWHGTARKIRRIHLPHGAGEVLLGVTGAAGLMPLAEHAIPTCDDSRSIPDGGLDEWADYLARYLTETAATAVPPITEPDRDGMTVPSGTLVLGYRGRLWHLLTHHALPVTDGITAVGVGADLALGYLLGARATDAEDSRLFPTSLVQDAVRAACDRLPYCYVGPTGPIVEHLGPVE